jgi:hypothetical protein
MFLPPPASSPRAEAKRDNAAIQAAATLARRLDRGGQPEVIIAARNAGVSQADVLRWRACWGAALRGPQPPTPGGRVGFRGA